MSANIEKTKGEKASELQEASVQKLTRLDELSKEAHTAWSAQYPNVSDGKYIFTPIQV